MNDTYEIYAVHYGHHDRPESHNFIGGDGHDNMPLDYFVWAIVGENKTFILDTGFAEDMQKKRGRQIIRPVAQGLESIGIDPAKVTDVVISHMHYDHAGNLPLFPNAKFHIQDAEMQFVTGRLMCHAHINWSFEPAHVAQMVHKIFEGRAEFHDGVSELAPGLTLHRVSGHTKGLQVMRVKTKRGHVVLASDAAHLYANMDRHHPFPTLIDIGDYLEAFKTMRKLASSEAHIVPGHDPTVLDIYPAVRAGLKGIVRLDLEPKPR